MAEANKERIFDEFVELVSVPCHTLKERQVFELLQQKLKDLGFVTQEDDAGKELGGECGNLWGWLPGNKVGAKRVLLTAHMDCVEPCEGIKVVKKDGKILSDGTTILGSDDKSGVVAILEAVRMLQETKAEHGDIQVLFTIAEEGGVNGSRCMDKSLLHADVGYALDSEAHPGEIVTAAPGQDRVHFKVHGKTAHGGLAPEKGINAILVAAKALAGVEKYARIDEETTCNIGVIHGGLATNIVPDLVEIQSDVRSRNLDKLAAQRDYLVNTVNAGVVANGGKVDVEIIHKYQPFDLSHDSDVVTLALESCKANGFTPDVTVTGGGSDANFINAYGVPCVILGTGMSEVHTVDEFILEEDLYNSVLMVYGILQAAAK